MTDKKLSKYVNVFYGCDERELPEAFGASADWKAIKPLCGNTSPAAVLPFGKYSVGPYSAGYTSGYGMHLPNSNGVKTPTFGDELRLIGFSHFHNSGVGAIGFYYNYAVVTPYYGEKADGYGVRDESAAPGYYAVTLAETGIRCELTVSENAAYHRYTFDRENGKISVDFSNNGLFEKYRGTVSDLSVKNAGENTLTASGVFSGVKLYFTAVFDGKGHLSDEGIFLTDGVGAVTVRVSVSAVSLNDSLSEIKLAADGFDTVKRKADDMWNAALGRISVTGDETEKKIFYSAMYHSLTKPNLWDKGSPLSDGGAFAVDFSTMWDIYKTELPLLFTLFSEVSEIIVDTFLAMSDHYGHFLNAFMLCDKTDICSEQARMLCVYSLYDAWKRGVKADWEKAYRLILRETETEDFKSFEATGKGKCASHTLDMACICPAIAEMASVYGTKEDAKRFSALSKNYINAFDRGTGLLTEDSKYYEGNRWNYSFRPLPFMDERIALCGGKQGFEKLLDRFFGFTDNDDTSARFEGFNNESDMEAPYSYHYIGRLDKLCDIVTSADRFFYRDKNGEPGRGGLPGNNDSGGMTSCYIWNTIGLFPVSGQDTLLISRPKFSEAVIKLSNGKTLTVERDACDRVPEKAFFNGEPLEDMKISVSKLFSGGTLKIV